jgi:CHAT domain-containing protein
MHLKSLVLTTLIFCCSFSSSLAKNLPSKDSTFFANIKLTMERWANRAESYAIDSALWYAEKGLAICYENQQWEAYMEMGMYCTYYAHLAGDQKRAMAFAKKAIDEGSKYLPKGNLSLREMYSLIGGLHGNEGNYREALEWGKRSVEGLAIDEHTPDKVKVEAITMWSELGQTYYRLGDYEQAFLYFEQARLLVTKEMQTKPLVFAHTAYNLYHSYGLAKNRKGDIEEGRALLQKAFSVAHENHPNEVWKAIDCNQELGWLEFEAGNYVLAMEYGYKGMKLQQTCLALNGRTHYPEVDYAIIGESLTKAGKGHEAIPWLKDAIIEIEHALKPSFGKHFRIGSAYLKYADAYASINKLDSALAHYQNAIIQFCGDFEDRTLAALPAPEQMMTTKMSLFTIRNKARAWEAVHIQDNDIQALRYAFETYMLLLDVMHIMRQQYRGNSAQLFVSKEAKPIYEAAINVALRIAHHTGEKAYIEKAFYLSEQSKAYLLFLQQHQAQTHIDLNIPNDILLKERSLKTRIESTHSRLLSEQQKGPRAVSDSIKVIKARLFEYNRAYDQFTDELEEQYPAYFTTRFGQQEVPLAMLKQYLKENDQTLIEYFIGDSSAFAFVVNSEKIEAIRLEAPLRWSTQLESVLQILSTPSYDKQDIDAFSTRSLASYDILIRSALGDTLPPKLLIIPDAALAYLPFSALLTDEVVIPAEANDKDIKRLYRNFPYLFKQTETSYAYSVRTLFGQQPNINPENTLLAMAPSYEGTLGLTFNREQVKQISSLYSSRPVLGLDAEEAFFRKHASKYNILHLAMHGQANREVPMSSRLLFYQTGAEEEEQDGILHAYEVYGLRLSAEMAVLSACETGAGILAPGEGVLSIARAFRFAGCKSVLYSLWQAEGKATNTMLYNFYRQLHKQHCKPYALQQAQRKFLETATPERTHPYYWSSFIISGQPQALSISSYTWRWWIVPLLMISAWFFWKYFKKIKAAV